MNIEELRKSLQEMKQAKENRLRQEEELKIQAVVTSTLRALAQSMTFLEGQELRGRGRPKTIESDKFRDAMVRTKGRLGNVGIDLPEELKVDELILPQGKRVELGLGPNSEEIGKVVVDLPQMRIRVDAVREKFKKK